MIGRFLDGLGSWWFGPSVPKFLAVCCIPVVLGVLLGLAADCNPRSYEPREDACEHVERCP